MNCQKGDIDMRNLLETVKEIECLSGNNDKLNKLKTFFSQCSPEELDLVKIVYDPQSNFYLTENALDDITLSGQHNENVLEILQDLVQKKYKSKEEILSKIANLSEDYFLWFKKMLRKQLFDGISVKSLNNIYKELSGSSLYPEFPYMRCSLMEKIKHIKFPAIAQIKADGMFVNIVVKNGNVELFSRQGKKFQLSNNDILLTKITNQLKEQLNDWSLEEHDYVFMGELLVTDEYGTILPREIGNGMLTSLSKQFDIISTLMLKKQTPKVVEDLKFKEKQFQEIQERVIIRVWDYLRYREWQGQDPVCFHYHERLNHLKNKLDGLISIIESKEVNSFEEAQSYYQEALARHEEGIILKNKDLLYKNGTSNECIKFKEVKECELKVIGFEYGSGKYSQCIGSLICTSADNKVVVKISGLTDAMRGVEPVDKKDSSKGLKVIDGFDMNQYNGKIISVEFNQIIKAEGSETYSLFLPRIQEFREDKDTADDFEYIKSL